MSKEFTKAIESMRAEAAKILAKLDELCRAHVADDAPPEVEAESHPSAFGFPACANPLKAPWPPGVDCRVIHHGPRGHLFQLRPGALMEDGWYRKLMMPRLSLN